MSASLKVVCKQHLPDIAFVTGILIAVTLLTQRWAGVDTPDSSFYTSLGIFGSEVTDRAFDNSYFWTRLGTIAPTHLLTNVFGTWTGFAIWHALLLLLFIVGSYIAIRKFTGVPMAAVLTACISFSSVPLSYLANPYLTGAVLAGTSALIATALFQSKKAAVTGGVILGWLVMVNPPGVLLAGVVWLVVKFQRRYQIRQKSSALTKNIATAAIATILTFIAFLGIGKIIFPELNWFSAYLDAQGINLSDFASKNPVWLQDVSLLVPLSILFFTAILWLANKSNHAAQLGFAISASSVGFMLVFSPLMGGIALEAPMYQAMLWPPALIGLALSITATATATATGQRWSLSQGITAAVAIGLIVIAGHWAGSFGLHAGQLLAAILVAVAARIVLMRGSKYAIQSALIAVCILVAGGQLLQNSRGPLGLYYLSPYNWAFNKNPISEKLHTAVNTQEWLLENTKNSDTILTWVQGDWVNGDRELYVVAGMQLWGENRIGLFSELNADDLVRLNSIKPNVIAMYGQSMPAIRTFMTGLPSKTLPTAPNCYDFTWPAPQIPAGHACLTTLTWTN